VKRSGRDEPIRIVIHICMKAMLGISLYSYPMLKCYVFSTKLKKRAEQVLPGSEGDGGRGGAEGGGRG
jgi:hypothetical protein